MDGRLHELQELVKNGYRIVLKSKFVITGYGRVNIYRFDPKNKILCMGRCLGEVRVYGRRHANYDIRL